MTCVPFANRSWRLRGTEEAATALPPGATATTTADLASPSNKGPYTSLGATRAVYGAPGADSRPGP